MRRSDAIQESLFALAELEGLVPDGHPLRPIRSLVNGALACLNGLSSTIYADSGRSSIAPRKAAARHAHQGVLLCAQRTPTGRTDPLQPVVLLIHDLVIDDEVWDHSVFPRTATGCWSTGGWITFTE